MRTVCVRIKKEKNSLLKIAGLLTKSYFTTKEFAPCGDVYVLIPGVTGLKKILKLTIMEDKISAVI